MIQTPTSDAVELLNAEGQGPAVLLCEHASHRIPESYGDLGLSPEDRLSHAAWDPGALPVAMALSRMLDAPLVASRVSRLVYDCNRPPEAPSAMPEKSEAIEVPGNRGLTPEDRLRREQEVYRPFVDCVGRLLDARLAAGLPTTLVTVHSFTPVFHGQKRAVEIGILHDDDSRVADIMLREATGLRHRRVARNAPYGPEDGVTHSLRLHAISRGLPNVMLEIRNDLLKTGDDQMALAWEIHQLLIPALAAVGPKVEGAADA